MRERNLTDEVAVVGAGVVSALGHDRKAFWEACLAGRSGARRVDGPWVERLETRIAAPVDGFDAAAAGLERAQLRNLDRTSVFAVAAALEALRDAGFALRPSARGRRALEVEGVDPDRLATSVGSGIGGLRAFEIAHAAWRERGRDAVKRYALPMLIPNAPAGQVALTVGARGECKAISTACAAGTMAIGDACRLIRDGDADVVLAGGAEGVAGDEDAYGLMGFERLGTLSRRNDDPQRASRPFDRDRDGFVLGEGAAVLVLERAAHARARGVRPWATIAGYAANCDAYSMMQPDESGESIRRLIAAALADADLPTDAIESVHAHGTSTPANDRTESLALRAAFGARTDDLPVTALKSMTGHAIAASGALETVAAALALRDGVLPPTINYETPDPECPVAVVANRARPARARTALKLSYGFGGHNACLVLRAPDGGPAREV